ncbi:hypothetical protein C2845_PM11G17930 [Panicum miliaceum]|uniref:Uncharacterized protein n=1 Tax=Panicum miliaceum TaxID=4540 RepID=A0A3L6RU58_PANMI|nr:hypothetical protein C2845_PM11G17930 [Panicum miliaceum]
MNRDAGGDEDDAEVLLSLSRRPHQKRKAKERPPLWGPFVALAAGKERGRLVLHRTAHSHRPLAFVQTSLAESTDPTDKTLSGINIQRYFLSSSLNRGRTLGRKKMSCQIRHGSKTKPILGSMRNEEHIEG